MTDCATTGVQAYAVATPPVLGSDELAVLRAIGLPAVTEVAIRPVGLVPALWDGEGAAEWIAGESPIVGVSSSRAISKCIFTLDGDGYVVDWPAVGDELFARLDNLDVGPHQLHVALLPVDTDEPVADGSLDLIIRIPVARPTTGSFREGLMILATPVNPTLTEIWDGTASLEVLGPTDAQVTIDVSLAGSSNKVLTRRRLGATLPIDGGRWALLVRELRGTDEVQRFYDEAESSLISISHPELGTVSLRCEREFSPLRWIAGRDGEVPFVRLVNNMEGSTIAIDLLEFAGPDRPIAVEMEGSRVRWPAGGLVTARANGVLASVILPPSIRGLADLTSLNVRKLSSGPRSFDEVRRLIDLAYRWSTASLPANPFAATGRISVERAITSHLAGLIGGQRWAFLERRAARDSDDIRTSELEAALGNEPYQQALARALLREIDGMTILPPEKRVQPLATLLASHARHVGPHRGDPHLAEFLLRLASDPASLATVPQEELMRRVDLVLTSPLLLRAARLIVLAVDAIEADDVGATHRGWAWE